jgi:predicted hydrolase (HD superfamily)
MTKTVHQALQAVDIVNGFIQALRQAAGEEDIKAICQSEIARIKQRESPTIAKRTISRYRSVVGARLGANHPAGQLLAWE